ncbi:hypothetical protein [Mycolicibacterium sp.]|uniref:hypothetical protein n=1 Tax=Mycolicibacterium sp. TaxID=2320850 RepID=UPI0037CB2C3C
MTMFDAASWAAVAGGILGLIAATYGFWSARRARSTSRPPHSTLNDSPMVVIVSPAEERRYFRNVPAGVSTQVLLSTIATAIQEIELTQRQSSPGLEQD